jgi:hypothetical protein
MIKVWFHPDVADYIKEKIWHESQKIHKQPDGSIIFEAQVAGTNEIRFWIMTWGSKAVVLEPESLRGESGQRRKCWQSGMKGLLWLKRAIPMGKRRIILCKVVEMPNWCLKTITPMR